jgi:hypothetical protein
MFELFLKRINRFFMKFQRSRFPQGFSLVLAVRDDDKECSGRGGAASSSSSASCDDPTTTGACQRLKKLRFRVQTALQDGDYWLPTIVPFLCYILLLILTSLLLRACLPQLKDEADNKRDVEQPQEQQELCTLQSDQPPKSEAAVVNAAIADAGKTAVEHELHIERVERRARRYICTFLTLTVFYCVPVLQLILKFRQIVDETGAQDICYHNSLCAHPFWGLSDFNHVYSNVGYVFLGLAFAAVVRYRQTKVRPRPNRGVHLEYGLFYTLAICLVLEGILSAFYHICPNKANFQFGSLKNFEFKNHKILKKISKYEAIFKFMNFTLFENFRHFLHVRFGTTLLHQNLPVPARLTL